MAHLLLIYLLKIKDGDFSCMFVYKMVCFGKPSSYSWDGLLNPRSWTFETVATCSNDGRLGRDGEEMGKRWRETSTLIWCLATGCSSETHNPKQALRTTFPLHQISCCCFILCDCFVCFCNPPQLFVTPAVKQPWQTKEWNKKLEKAEESLGPWGAKLGRGQEADLCLRSNAIH